MSMRRCLRCLPVAMGVLALLATSGCVTRSAVTRVDDRYWAKHHADNALTSGSPGAQTRAYLELRGWPSGRLRDPVSDLTRLRAELVAQPDRRGLVAFAETAFREGNRARDPAFRSRCLMTAARAAYAVLFDATAGVPLRTLDPDNRMAADIYNHALSTLLDDLMATGTATNGVIRIPMVEGLVTLAPDVNAILPVGVSNLVASLCYRTDALPLHHRRKGIGVPVVTVADAEVVVADGGMTHPPVLRPGLNPYTLLVRFNEPWSTGGESLTATLAWRHALVDTEAEIAGRTVPLEADTSLALAMLLDRGAAPRSLMGKPRLLRSDHVEDRRGLYLLQPYDPDRIPVVLIHGLMDSPLTWLPLVNALVSDPELNRRYQFWLFFYPTMNPVLQSAAELRNAIEAFRMTAEREVGTWRDMVLVGHSMGGLIARLLSTASDGAFDGMYLAASACAANASVPRDLFAFAPVPGVSRAVFIGTPHKGATMANSTIGLIGQNIMTRPRYLEPWVACLGDSIDDLAPDSAFTVALNRTRWRSGIAVHSIIGDMFEAGRTGGTDSVVAYQSAHVEGAESECIVRAGHLAVQEVPGTITEVRRILIQHPEP